MAYIPLCTTPGLPTSKVVSFNYCVCFWMHKCCCYQVCSTLSSYSLSHQNLSSFLLYGNKHDQTKTFTQREECSHFMANTFWQSDLLYWGFEVIKYFFQWLPIHYHIKLLCYKQQAINSSWRYDVTFMGGFWSRMLFCGPNVTTPSWKFAHSLLWQAMVRVTAALPSSRLQIPVITTVQCRHNRVSFSTKN